MNKKSFIFIILLFVLTIPSISQTTKYYKFIKKVENNIPTTNVEGGQYVTFLGDICYESNNKGIGVGHGTLKKSRNHSTSAFLVYIGSSYWGTSTTFRFNSDKSILNVVLGNGDIYLYKQNNPPLNVTTCSLIRQKSSNHNPEHTPIMTDVPIQEDNERQATTSGHYEEYFEKCIECNGQGFIATKTYMGGGEVSDVKRRCAFCHGIGQIRKSKYVVD